MYRIYHNGNLIYTPRNPNKTVGQAKLTQKKNCAGTIKMVLYPDNPAYEKVEGMASFITVKENAETIYEGRITKVASTLSFEKTIETEGALAYLNDSIIRPFEFKGSVKEFITKILQDHNDQVESRKQFLVGEVGFPQTTLEITENDYKSAMQHLQNQLPDTLGGYLEVRYGNGKRYLDYLEKQSLINTQAIEYGKNLLDLSDQKAGTDIATVIIPLGAKDENSNRITIESVNDGKDYLINDDALKIYGKIVKKVQYDDATSAEALKQKAENDLPKYAVSDQTIELTAADLAEAGYNIRSFTWGQKIKCRSRAHGIDTVADMVSKEIDLCNPANSRITAGSIKQTYTSENRAEIKKDFTETKESFESILNQARKELQGNLDSAAGLYKTAVTQADGSKIFYLHDKKTLEESNIVIKANAKAIGLSVDGGNTYSWGFEFDGDAILNEIYTKGINASYIKTGRIEVKDSDDKTLFCADIDTGEVMINSGLLKVGTGFVSTDGRFKIGPIYSGNGKLVDGVYEDQDIFFGKAIFVDYGAEIFGNNDSAAHTPYMDFHLNESINDPQTDYTARIEQSSENVINIYGKRKNDGDTPQSCTLNVAVVNTASDLRLKDKVQYLNEETSLEFINKLRPAAYRYTADDDKMYHYGLIYQDVEPIIKSKNCALLGKLKRWEKQDGESKQVEYGALGYIELISDLIGAVKALTAKVKELEEGDSTK